MRKWRLMPVAALLLILATCLIFLPAIPAHAQGEGAVQEFSDRLEPETGDFYIIPELQAGQQLSVYAEAASGNLDPFVGIFSDTLDPEEMLDHLRQEYAAAIAQGLDPLAATRQVADEVFVVWNDDSASGSPASVAFTVPADGDYSFLLLPSPGQRTFGDYRLLIGVDASDVASGSARDSGDNIAYLAAKIPPSMIAVDEITGVFNSQKTNTLAKLRPLSAGDTVYLYAESVAGDFEPVVTLRNFRAKPLLTDNFTGESTTAALKYVVPEDTDALYVNLSVCCNEEPSTEDTADDSADVGAVDATDTAADGGGEYRIQVGINTPEALSGDAEPTDAHALESPRIVEVGLKMDQITGVDQVSENFGVVVNLRLEYDDPDLAFNPDDCNCFFQTYTPSEFEDHLARLGVEAWPVTTVFNQQGRRDEQGTTIVVESNGHVTYINRFTATLQAPDFNFRQFPFDKQTFHIRLRSVFPEEFYVYVNQEDYTAIGQQLGEEEWLLTDWTTTVDTSEGRSRFNFTFQAVRHLDYYLYRIFIPLLVIILVSWAIFFLRNYEKRVDASAANLLLLIAFNFTISGNLPKLGYLTLMDIVLITIFVVTGLVLVINVYLRRVELAGNRERAERIDRYVLWLYPIAYAVMIAFIGLVFFVRS